MTVQVKNPQITHVGNGTAAPLAVPFRFLDVSHLAVYSIVDGERTLLTRGTHYSVQGAGASVGGTVTPLAPIPTDTRWKIIRITPLAQPTQYEEGFYSAAAQELALDRNMLALQEMSSRLDFVPALPVEGAPDGYVPVVRNNAWAVEPSVEVEMGAIEEALEESRDATQLALEAAANVTAFRINFKVTDASQGVFELPITPTVTPELKVDGVVFPGPGSPDPIWVIDENVITLAQDAYRDQIVSVSVGYASLLPQVQAENVVGFGGLVPIAPFSHAASYAPGSIGDRFKRCVFITDAPYLASPTRTGAFNQAALDQAVADVGMAGGGVIFAPAGVYRFVNAKPAFGGSGGWDRDVIIDLQYDNVHLVGAGRGATVFINEGVNTTYSQFIKIGRRVGTPNIVTNVQVRNLSIVGNWAVGQSTTSIYTNSGIDVSNGCSNIVLDGLSIDHCGGYGIGFQRDGFTFCKISDVIITDTAYDGIDWKMDTNNSGFGNIVQHVTVLRFALVQDNVDGRQAGIDVRQGVDVCDCYIGEYGAGIAGCRVNTPFDNGFVKKSVVDNIKCYAASTNDTYGLHITGNGTQVSNIYTGGCEQDVWWRATNSQLVNLIANNGVNGLRIYAAAGETMQNNQFSNIRTTGNSGHGIRIDGEGTIASMVFTNVVSVSNTQSNLFIAANCNDLMFIGGDIPSGIQDSGQNTRFIGVSGVWADRGGRNKSQYIERSGDDSGNYLTGRSVVGLPKPLRIRSDANSGDLILEALAAGASIRLGAGAPYAPSADAAIVGTITVLDAAGNPRKLGVVA